MWKDQENCSISHFLIRAGDITTQVKRIEELKDRRYPKDLRRKRKRREDTPNDRTNRDNDRTPPKRIGKWKPGDKWLRHCLNPEFPGMQRIEDCSQKPADDKKLFLTSILPS